MRPTLFDTHAHLQLASFDDDREEALARARDAGVQAVLTVGFTLATSRLAVALAERHADCWATVGLHPHEAREWSPRLRDALRDLAQHPRVRAIGEAGLDYYRDLSPREAQEEAFVGQMALARELGLPLVVHNRDATGDMLDLVERYASGITCLLHAFSGDWPTAHRALGLGCAFGIGGAVTYRKADLLRDAVARLPVGSFVVETDAPWLPPQSRRGRRNEPAFLRETAEAIARVRHVAPETLADETTQSALRFFGMEIPGQPAAAQQETDRP
jgi:TatD DNase family protein